MSEKNKENQGKSSGPKKSDLTIKAIASGILKLGDREIPCFVLSNKKRVLVMREVVELLTGNRKGGLERYTSAPNVREFMPPKFVDQPHRDVAIPFPLGNGVAYGYEAEDLIEICEAYLKTRKKGTLHPTQVHLADEAEILIRAAAKTGIVALIDEATGYQAMRDADELQVKIQAYIAKDLNDWTKTFPTEFFDNLYRLEGTLPPIPRKPYPQRFGRYVMAFVYDTLDPDVADWLRKNNPKPQGREHHHQWFTENFGYPKLTYHLREVMGIQRVSSTMEAFKENLARAYEDARTKRRARNRQEKLKESGQLELPQFTYL